MPFPHPTNYLPVQNFAILDERDWADKFELIQNANFTGWRTSAGGYAGINLGNLEPKYFLDSPAAADRSGLTDISTYPKGHGYTFPWSCVATWIGGEPQTSVSITLRADSGMTP
jgi:hypothetical protein